MADEPVVVALSPDTPEVRYALDTLLHLLGLTARASRVGERADLAYGDADGRVHVEAGPQDGWNDPAPRVTRDGGLAIVHRPAGPARARGERGIGFDVFYAAYACLTAPWERVDAADRVGTPVAASGWLAAHDLLLVPSVHHYAALLAEALGRGALPEPSLVLSHDVDSNFGHLFAVRESAELLRRELAERRLSAARRAAGLGRRVARRAFRNGDPNDRWADWSELHAPRGGRPAYFVASASLFDRGADRYDPPYDIAHPEVRDTLRALAGDGAEIGVHFSLTARRSPEAIAEERERLESVVGAPVRSARHHWWALGNPPEPTLRAHAAAGIRLDCSFGFNDRLGFRRGIAYPFRPFDPETRQTISLWALPTTAMDIAVFNDHTSEEVRASQLEGLVRATREAGGALVLNWHAHALNPRVLDGSGAGLSELLASLEPQDWPARTPLEAADAAEARAVGGR